jgi:hypothetical protein
MSTKAVKGRISGAFKSYGVGVRKVGKPVSIGLQDQLLSIHREQMEEKATILLDFLKRLEGGVHG